jgi:N-acetylglucosamine-6-phosphate deacetylase
MHSPEPREAAAPASYLLAGTVISDGHAQADSVVAVSDGRIAYAGPRSGFDAADFPLAQEISLPTGSSILPGLIDLHCHGAAGGDFPTGDSDACRTAAEYLHRSGAQLCSPAW